jgi:hypothetical protein
MEAGNPGARSLARRREVWMLRTAITIALALAAVPPVQASAQAPSELTMFSRGQFMGSRTAVAGPMRGIDPAVTVRSITVPPGTQWELCSGSTFTGCRQYSESQHSMVMTVRSVRPLAPVITAGPSTPPSAMGPGQSLHGWASEYFVSPDVNGVRVQVDAGQGMSERAREFCRSRGWRAAAYQRVQTVGPNSYLADVLCVDVGN